MGIFLKWLINLWVSISGKKCSFDQYPWLNGPMGDELLIGDDFYSNYAAKANYEIEQDINGGLVENFLNAIPDEDVHKMKLLSEISDFYEHTAAYKLEVWSQWYAPYDWFARVLIKSLSRKMNQLNIPLDPLETSRGMSNQVIHLRNRLNGKLEYTCWLRKSILTGKVVYSGFYSSVLINETPFIKVVFPLPNGNATVLLRVEVLADGSVKLISDGKKIGDAGYYRVQGNDINSVKVKYVPLKEVIHVFKDEFGVLRTDHVFKFFSSKMLHLHYKISKS